MATDRRTFVLGAGGIITAAALAPKEAAAKTKAFAVPLSKVPDLNEVGGSVRLKLAGQFVVFVRDSEKTVRALDATCTHKKCKVAYKAETGKLHCECHKSAFNLKGEVQGGPAPKDLPTYPTKLTPDRVLIKVPVKE